MRPPASSTIFTMAATQPSTIPGRSSGRPWCPRATPPRPQKRDDAQKRHPEGEREREEKERGGQKPRGDERKGSDRLIHEESASPAGVRFIVLTRSLPQKALLVPGDVRPEAHLRPRFSSPVGVFPRSEHAAVLQEVHGQKTEEPGAEPVWAPLARPVASTAIETAKRPSIRRFCATRFARAPFVTSGAITRAKA